MLRLDGREAEELRSTQIILDYQKHPLGSVLITSGNTKIICSVSSDEKVPAFLRDSGQGWITAEYSLLPSSTHTRANRERKQISGRTSEIQRLIGRSLRAITDLEKIGSRTLIVDCDVIEADGGTRTLAITGAIVALYEALKKLEKRGKLNTKSDINTIERKLGFDSLKKLRDKQNNTNFPLKQFIAAVSVGIVAGVPLLDLCYQEDYIAEVDMNIIMTEDEKFIEVQGTAEINPFTQAQLDILLNYAKKGIKQLINIQKSVLSSKYPLLQKNK